MMMLESLHSAEVDAGNDYVMDDDWLNPITKVDHLMYNHVQIEGIGSGPISQGEETEVDHLLPQSQTEKSLDDGSMYLNLESTEKCLAVDNLTCALANDNKEVDYCMLGSNVAEIERQESKYEFVDSMLRGVDNERDLHLPCDLSSLCHDFLSDSAYEGFSMVHDPSSDEVKRLGLRFQSQLVQKDINANEVADLSDVNPITKSVSGCSTSVLDNMDVHQLHNAVRNTSGRDTCVTLKHRIFFGLQTLGEVDNVCSILESESPSTENEEDMILIPGNDLCERLCTFLSDDKRTLTGGRGLRHDGHSVEESQKITSELSRVRLKIQNSGKHETEFATGNQKTTPGVSRVRLKIRDSGEYETEFATGKRLHKPTRRFIEEISGYPGQKSRCSSERLENTVSSSKAKSLCVRKSRVSLQKKNLLCQNYLQKNLVFQNNLQKKNLICQNYHAASIITQVQRPLPVRRGRPSKSVTPTNSDSETLADSSEETLDETSDETSDYTSDDSTVVRNKKKGKERKNHKMYSTVVRNKKKGKERKNHKMWILSEVVKLVDGVSQYGVGRWTEMKRVLFPTSPHRTPVDLKDKWRNLLRTSATQLGNKRKVEQHKKKSGTLSVPPSILRRVRELSIIHPYPRPFPRLSPRSTGI